MTKYEREFRREYPVRLRFLRRRLRLSEAQAAADHGVTLHTYRRWEAGVPSTPSAKPGMQFCKKHGLAFDYYFAGKLPMRFAWH